MKHLSLLIATLLAGPALADVGENDAAEPPRNEKREIHINVNGAGASHFVFEGAEMGLVRGGKAIKNAPYSAEIVTERVQTLADGNQIVNKQSQLSYRDSQGRLRTEVRDAKGEVRAITIHDADGTVWTLRPATKTATKVAVREFGRGVAEAARARVEALRKDGKAVNVESIGPGEHVIVKRIERGGDAPPVDVQRIHENVQIRVGQQLRDLKAPGGEEWSSQISAVMGNAFSDLKWSRKGQNKDLGSKDIEGVKAEGKQRSYEIPAGEMGNKNPIVVSSETWYSPELQITLYSKHSDPRSGERIYRVSNLKREEPKAELFSVPADYKVHDAMARIQRSEKKE